MASEEGLTSSPVLDFLERKLAFEKTLNPSTHSLNSRSRGVKNLPPPKHSIISNNVSMVKPLHNNEASPVLVRTGKFPPSYRNNNSPKHRRTQSVSAFTFRTRSHSANSSSFSDNSSPETPRSTTPSNVFRKPKNSSPIIPRHSLSSNSDSANKSESSSASDTPRNTPTSNIFKRFEESSCEIIPSSNFFKSKENPENSEIRLDSDSEKELDATETSPTKKQRWGEPKNDALAHSETRLSGHPYAKGPRSNSDDRLSDRVAKVHEEIPVFCVQDFNRGRGKDHRASPSRSRSVGSELKARREVKDESATQEEKRMGWRWNKSSDELINDQQTELASSGFKDKQKMIEAVINKGSTADVTKLDSKQIAKESKKCSNVFRKMSFTTKLDKDMHNNIAKGDVNIRGVSGYKNSNRFFMNCESNFTTSGKVKFSKIIPKLNPLGSALRHSPPLPSDKNKQSESLPDDNSCDVTEAGGKHCEESDSGVVIRNAKNRDIIKELQEKNFLDTSHSPKRKSLPENDLVKLKAASECHKRQHSGSFPDKELIKLKPKPALNPKPKLNGLLPTPIKPTPNPSPQKEAPDATPANNHQSQPISELDEPGTCGPPVRPPRRRNSGSPRKKNKAPLPPTPVAGSPVSLESAPVYSSPSGVVSPGLAQETSANISPASVPDVEVPFTITQKISAVTREPSSVTRESSGVTHESSPVTSEPSATTREPSAATREPSSVTREPSSVTREPSSVTREPSAVPREPSPATRAPSPVTREPAAVTRESTAVTRESTAVTRESTAVTREPAVVTRDPVSVTREPAAMPNESSSVTWKSSRETQKSSVLTTQTSPETTQTPPGVTQKPSRVTHEQSSGVTQELSMPSVASFPITADLPPGPPPRKPPRTFAHEIYASNKIRQLSNGNIETPLALPSSNGTEPVEPTKPQNVVIAPVPVYAVPQKKKHSIPSDNNGGTLCKPTIAPKPAHIKSLVSSNNGNVNAKRLSLIETSTVSLTPSDSDAVAADEQIKKVAHTRFSFRRTERSPPDQPPPEPPSGPKPLPSPRLSSPEKDLGPRGGMGCGPTSLQCWASEDFAYMTEGKLNRQKSQSDETLASYSGYHRIQGPAVEPIYATPQLGSSNRSRAASGGELHYMMSGGELHYMCSDLLATGRGDDVGLDTSCKKPASRTNLIAAWKQEFRQSCRLVQHRLKKTVNR